ncbi:MAG: hypothetical protein U5N86_09245 [Planctomycetota bacterium]|nr:hypothetical protein [Planctomycetota bacterium]
MEQRLSKPVANKVRTGGSLVTLAGVSSYGAGGYAGSPIAEILPFEIADKAEQYVEGAVKTACRPPKSLGPITTWQPFDDRAPVGELKNRFKQFPPFGGYVKVGKVRPDSSVIASTLTGEPLIIQRSVQQGKVVSLAIDATWEWAFNPFEDERDTKEAFNRFWRRMALELVFDNSASGHSVDLQLDSGNGMPDEEKSVTVAVTDPERKPVDSMPRVVAHAPNLLQAGRFPSLSLSGTGHTEAPLSPSLTASTLSMPRQSWTTTSSALTRASCTCFSETARPPIPIPISLFSSRLLSAREAYSPQRAIASNIRVASAACGTRAARPAPPAPDSIWASPAVFLVLIALMSFEWFLRRKRGLP